MLSRNRRDAKKAPAWLGRAAFTPELTPLEHAVAMAKAAGNNPALPAVLLADVADNPGGGGRGNTPFILRALLKEKVRNAMLGVITDPSPILSRFDFKRLPRPVVPIDALAEWTPQIRLLSKRTPKVAGYEFDEQTRSL